MEYIMIIDDSATVRLSVEYSVKELGYPVKMAENGIDALEKIDDIRKEGSDIALCIVDINMPRMNGISFVKELRKTDRFTPILMLTTESEESKIQEGREAGASAWIVKPFRPDELINITRKLIH